MTQLSLPEEFVLLLHKDGGGYHTGAAELGELVLRGRIRFEGRKLQLVDPSPTGEQWADTALALLARRAGAKNKRVDAARFIQSRRGTRTTHCESLVRRGLMRCERKSLLGIGYRRYYPDTAAREALIGELRAVARGEQQVDNRTALLAALSHATGLVRTWRLPKQELKRLKQISRGEQLGAAVEAVVASAAAAVAAGTIAATTAATTGGS